MIRLKPNQPPAQKKQKEDYSHCIKVILRSFFAKDYKTFLETNDTTDEGMMFVEKHYSVDTQWKAYLNDHNKNNRADKCYQVLLIVKTMSKQDNI
jgi:hypothetical protein